jgi:hypothetical protein
MQQIKMSMISDILVYGVTFVMMVLAMWLTSKVLKFKKQDIKPAVFMALVLIIVEYVLSLLSVAVIDPLIYGMITLAILVLAWVLSIKIFYTEGWIKTIAAFIIMWIITSAVTMFLGVILWQMGAFSP